VGDASERAAGQVLEAPQGWGNSFQNLMKASVRASMRKKPFNLQAHLLHLQHKRYSRKVVAAKLQGTEALFSATHLAGGHADSAVDDSRSLLEDGLHC
jgi:hypothetical protein